MDTFTWAVEDIVAFLEKIIPSEDCCENTDARTLLHLLPEDHPDFERFLAKFERRVYGTDSGC